MMRARRRHTPAGFRTDTNPGEILVSSRPTVRRSGRCVPAGSGCLYRRRGEPRDEAPVVQLGGPGESNRPLSEDEVDELTIAQQDHDRRRRRLRAEHDPAPRAGAGDDRDGRGPDRQQRPAAAGRAHGRLADGRDRAARDVAGRPRSATRRRPWQPRGGPRGADARHAHRARAVPAESASGQALRPAVPAAHDPAPRGCGPDGRQTCSPRRRSGAVRSSSWLSTSTPTSASRSRG